MGCEAGDLSEPAPRTATGGLRGDPHTGFARCLATLPKVTSFGKNQPTFGERSPLLVRMRRFGWVKPRVFPEIFTKRGDLWGFPDEARTKTFHLWVTGQHVGKDSVRGISGQFCPLDACHCFLVLQPSCSFQKDLEEDGAFQCSRDEQHQADVSETFREV